MSGMDDGGAGRGPEAGWYPDPGDDQQIRWWDGSAWSAHVRPATDLRPPAQAPDLPPAPATPPPVEPRAEQDTTVVRTPQPEPQPTRAPHPASTPPPEVGPAPTPEPGRRRGRTTVLVAAAVVALFGIGAGAVFGVDAMRSDDDAGALAAEPARSDAPAELFLEPVDQPGPDAFTAPLGTPDSFVPDPVTVSRPTGETEGVLAVASDTPGLYGGTGANTCDVTALVDHLADDTAKREAFADVLEVTPADLDDHIADLVPVLLSRDTRVTNHGYVDGVATPRQSVLEAGTAVLVDDQGVPRVRCECGNPLLEPTELSEHEIVGTAWSGYDRSESITVVPAADPLDTLTVQTPDGLEDIRIGGPPADALVQMDVLRTWDEPCGEPGMVATFDDEGRWSGEITDMKLPVGAALTGDYVDLDDDGFLDAVYLYQDRCGATGRMSGQLGVVLADPTLEPVGTRRVPLESTGEHIELGRSELREVRSDGTVAMAYLSDADAIPFTVELDVAAGTYRVTSVDGIVPNTPENAVRGFFEALMEPGSSRTSIYGYVDDIDGARRVAQQVMGLQPGQSFDLPRTCTPEGADQYQCYLGSDGAMGYFAVVSSASGVEGLDGYRVRSIQGSGGM